MFQFPDGSQLLEVDIHGGPNWQKSRGTKGVFDPGGGHWGTQAVGEDTGKDTTDWWREDGNTGHTTKHKTDQLIFRNREISVLKSTPSVFDSRDRRILAVWLYGNKWCEILNIRFFKAARLTQAVPPWMKNVRGWQIIFQLPSNNAGSHTWAESGAHTGKYGAEDDRMESVNQRGPWWPERTAGLPELMVRWRGHRYLSHYHSRWWTQASLKTLHPWQIKKKLLHL